MLEVILSAAAFFVLSVWLESFAVPQNGRLRLAGGWMKLLVFAVFYGAFFALTYRPLFSGVAVVAGLAVLLGVNWVKFKTLREPLIFSDFVLFKQAFVHPRLYLAYVGVGPLLGGGLAVAGLIYGGLVLEAPVWRGEGLMHFGPRGAFFVALTGLGLMLRHARLQRTLVAVLRGYDPVLDPGCDVERLGLVATLVIYWGLWLGQSLEVEAPANAAVGDDPSADAVPGGLPDAVPGAGPGALPDVIAIQNESFFDVRRLGEGIDQNLLPGWDACTAQSALFGRLEVPAWGANTMRTEFAFLTGIPYHDLGLDKFNPYLSFAKQPMWSMVHHFKKLGYRTVCIHPYEATFFDRLEVFPHLGFDEFLDIKAFAGAKTYGPYVEDRAVGDKILEVLGTDATPVFVFAITMENHGQWSTARLSGVAGEPPLPQQADLPLGSAALYIYLRHLANSDAMLQDLIKGLHQRDGQSVLCMFGDHVPSLEKAYATSGYEDTRTDYVIWRSSPSTGVAQNVKTDELPHLLVDQALGGRYPYVPPRIRIRTAGAL